MINIYLGGPIGKGEPSWRNKFKSTSQVNYINPETYYFQDYNMLVKADLANIAQSDIIFCYIPVLSAGTSMELVYASVFYNKPIIAVIHKNILSPWHRYHILNGRGIIVNTLKQGKIELNKKIKEFLE